MKTLLILGATGKVGQHILAQALAHPQVGQVIAPTRRLLAPNVKLLNPIVDCRALPAAPWWRADVCLCALGTTLRQAGSRQAFFEVDHDLVLAAARLAHQAGTPAFVLNSSLGASARAGNFYLQVKGKIEDDLTAIGFASLTIARPSLLDGGPRRRVTWQRTGEQEGDHHHPDQVGDRADQAQGDCADHAGLGIRLTCAATTRQPSAVRIQVWLWRPILPPAASRSNMVLAVAISRP